MATRVPESDERIHVENNVILTTKDEISVQQMFNYLTKNLDKFRVDSEFVIICGVHGSPHGKLCKSDEDFRYDYEMMNRWFKNHKKYGRQAKIVEDRKYKMSTVIEVNSIKQEMKEGQYLLTDESKAKLQNEFERILSLDKPVVLILASCWSFRSDISNILRSTGLYSALIISEERGSITAGKLFQLDHEQKDFLREITQDDTKKDIFIFGEYININYMHDN